MTEGRTADILLIEDNVSDAELTLRALKKRNVTNRVVHLRNGAEALAFLFPGQESGEQVVIAPKVILLDLKMPKVDGFQVLSAIRADLRFRSLPVVVLSSSAEATDIETSYALGANSYVVKPVDFDGFLKVVADLAVYWLLLNQTPGLVWRGRANAS